MDKNRQLEIIVGLFMLTGIIAISFLAFRLGDIGLFNQNQYELMARFTSASGLKQGAAVEMAGVKVGKVDAIRFNPDDYLAEVTIALDKAVRVPEDSIASIRTAGIIGDRFVKLSAGGSETMLANGGEIFETEPSINLEELISKYIFESNE